MPYQEITQQSEHKMKKALEVMSDELKGIRTGRATPALVENIRAEYYSTQTPLKQLATISVPEPRLIIIKPYDPTVLGEVEKAILKSELGITPANDGKLIRLAIPPLSEERRRQLSKMVKDVAERIKVTIRNIRRDGNKQAEVDEKEGKLPEDDKFRLKEDLQKLTEKYEKQVADITDNKTQEIMEV